jgi:hypothetical protein
MKPAMVLGVFAVLLFAPSALAHGGGIDAYGCHHDRKNGGYHCHRGALKGMSFATQADMLKYVESISPASGRNKAKESAPLDGMRDGGGQRGD